MPYAAAAAPADNGALDEVRFSVQFFPHNLTRRVRPCPLQDYEKNFKKGLLNDQTLPLLTDRRADTRSGCSLQRFHASSIVATVLRPLIEAPSFRSVPSRSALKEVKIPAGPRLRILHHVALARAAQANTRGGKSPAGPQQVAQVGMLSLALPVGCY